MKKSILWVAAGLLAGTAAFMLSKRKKNTAGIPALDDSNKSRHRTTVFSKMKNYG
ncbi:MAG TPA: LPXTG cell wall anchor domain-containing protein [Ferruginibacter sp.]|nr:LPXTG cell wall anchor domain-containing protein [Ferruginibacter sp.]